MTRAPKRKSLKVSLARLVKLIGEGKVRITMARTVAPCGHSIEESRSTGTPDWQNRWTCSTCGKVYSR